ncbi:MAG TPA: hypothetical protein VE173_15135 [Longimicrobiales bacterium]|nr:hypothetical protein [Longimicrobiales bacterium]
MLEKLGPSREAYRSAVVASVEELRNVVAGQREAGGDRARRLARELGPFATGRIDTGRLAGVLAVEERTLDPASLEVLERAQAVLQETAAETEDGWLVRVPTGGDLRDTVREAFGHAGIVFGAARAAELARTGTYRPEEHNTLFSGKPFHRWTAAERGLAPPLVVVVEGEDLRPAGLADFLDGAVKIVLLVRGDAPPAPLARVVTPGVTVIQTRDAATLDRMAAAPGPVLAAVFEPEADGVVSFTHDPGAGDLPWERLSVDADLDELRERLATGAWKERARAEDLAHLLALASPPATPASPATEAGAEEEDTAVDHLAAWLLARTDLQGT